MTEKKMSLEKLLSDFIKKDLPFFAQLVANLSDESVVSLPDQLRNINARLGQILGELNMQTNDVFMGERLMIKRELGAQIETCQTKIITLQQISKAQLSELAQGAQLLGSYRTGPPRKSNFLDSNG